MAHRFLLPDIGEGLVEAEIVTWHVAVGDVVAVDQVIVEVETAKSLVDIPSPFAGTVLSLGGDPGDVVEVGDVLIVIGEPGETVDAPEESSTVEPALASAVTAAVPSTGAPSKAMPAVRKLARDYGIDLATVTGTGPNGTITAADVEAAATTTTVPGDTRTPMSRTRRAIGEHMVRSWSEIPHVTTLHEARVDRLMERRNGRNGSTVPMEALVIKALIPVLEEFPEFNSSIDGDDLVFHARRDIGVAVDTPEGLIVPVVRSAESLSVEQLANSIAELASRAKARRASPDELAGATFTVTNIGAIGGGHGTPIIPHGTVAILAIGRGEQRPVVDDGKLAIGWVMPLSISYDHRVIDGAMGQRFMSRLIGYLEHPGRFLDE